MSPMDRERFEDLKDVYAFGALTEEELIEFEEYLSAHPELQDEVDDLTSTAGLLALAPDEHEPGPELRRRVLGAVGAEATEIEAARSRRLFNARNLALAAAAVLLVALGAWNVVLMDDLRGMRSELAQNREQPAIRLEGSGEAASARAELVEMRGKTVLVAEDVPEIPEDRTYQIWLIEGDRPASAGIFDPGPDASAAAVVAGSTGDADAIAVTVEPDGGSEAPTTQPVLSADL